MAKGTNRASRSFFVAAALVLAAMTGISTHAHAQSGYHNKPIRIIVGFVPGGTYDYLARLMGQHLSTSVGQPVVIENRPGVGGNLATQAAAKAAADGYTILHSGSPHVVNALLYAQPGYDPVKDFLPITLLAGGTMILVVHPSVQANNLKEFIAYAKSAKDGINYASSGIGTPSHLAMELLRTVAGFSATHVPYKGTGAQMIDVIGGRNPVTFVTPLGAVPNIKAGKVKVITVASLRRAALLPDVPTIAESGYSGFEVDSWQGWWVPVGTSRDIVARLHREAATILKIPEVKEGMIKNGADPIPTVLTPAQFSTYIESESVKFAKVIKDSGARAE